MPRPLLWGIVVCSLVVLAITRLPYRSDALASWDSANYALATERIDIAAHRPHPPGYLGYVFAGRALQHLTGDVNAALVLWNLVATFGAALVVARFAWDVNDGRARWLSATAAWAVLVTSPLFWFHGESAEIYVSELFVALLIAYSAWRAIDARPGALEWCAVAMGLAMLFKVTAAAFLLPLAGYAWVASSGRSRRRATWLLAAALAVVALVFLVAEPRVGQITWAQFTSAATGSPLLGGSPRTFNRHLRDTATAAASALGVVNLLALVWWAVLDRRVPRALGWRTPLLWAGPWMAFLVLVHIGRSGYILPLLPLAAVILGSFYARQRPGVAAALIIVQAAVNVLHFTTLPHFSADAVGGAALYRDKTIPQRIASDLRDLTLPTAATIAASDAAVARFRHLVATTCASGNPVVVAGAEPLDWRRVMWYARDATAIFVSSRTPKYIGHDTESVPVPGEGVTLKTTCPTIWIEPESGSDAGGPPDAVSTRVPGLGWITPAGATLYVSPAGIRVSRDGG